MKAKAAQYLNEIVSLTMLSLMVVALIAGQAAAESRRMAVDMTDRYVESDSYRLVIDTELEYLTSPIAEALLGEAASLSGEITLEIRPGRGDRSGGR